MYKFFTLVLVPFLVSVAAGLFTEWLIREYTDKRDNKQ